MRISLLGFMGTGKTTIGNILAHKLGLSFIDTDERIEANTGQTIEQLFSNFSEEYFRKLESMTLRKIIYAEDEVVISTGGGIVISPDNRELLIQNTRPVLLTASAEIILQRIKEQLPLRPLLAGTNPLQQIRHLLQQREKEYSQFNITVATDGKDPSRVAEEIITVLGV